MRTRIADTLTGNAGSIYREVIDTMQYKCPYQFVLEGYRTYESVHHSNPAINGRIFECLICETLANEGIVPFYYQARFEQVPNAKFDIVCYNPRRPVVLSAKTSLRERYKQADLEGLVLRQVYRNAESHLLTLDDTGLNVQEKIEEGDVVGLTSCILADSPEYNGLIEGLQQYTFIEAQEIMPIHGQMINAKPNM